MKNNFVLLTDVEPSSNLRKVCLEQTTYSQGHSKYGTLWSVWECPMYETDLGARVKEHFTVAPHNILLSKTGKEGLPRHFDINKWAVLNVPISGNFKESPIVFVDDMDNIIEASTYGDGKNPILFNARVNHAVLPSAVSRVVLSICWKIPYEEMLNLFVEKRFFKSKESDLFHFQ